MGWKRNAKGSSAEVDYVVSIGQKIVAVEVKSGTTGGLRSLRLFMQEKGSDLGIRISQQPISVVDGILPIPIYAISKLSALVTEYIAK